LAHCSRVRVKIKYCDILSNHVSQTCVNGYKGILAEHVTAHIDHCLNLDIHMPAMLCNQQSRLDSLDKCEPVWRVNNVHLNK
jgi:hypothetical protein